MNAEKFHASSAVPEISGLTNEQLEQLRNNITKELGRRTIEAMRLLISNMEAKSDDEYEKLVDKANVGDAEAQKELSDYQKAKAEIAKVDAVENATAEAEPAAEAPTAESEGVTEMIDAEKDEYLEEGMDKLPDEVLDQVVSEFDANNSGEVTDEAKKDEKVDEAEKDKAEKGEAEKENTFDNWASGEIDERTNPEDFNGVPIGKIEDDDGGIKDEIQKGIEKLAREGVVVGESEEEEGKEEEQAKETEIEKEVMADIDELVEQKANEIIEQLKEGEITKAEAKLEENFEQEAKKDKKRGNRMLKFFKKHPKLAKVAIVAIMAVASLGSLASFMGGSNSDKQNTKIEQSDDMAARAAEKAGDVATGAGARLEDEAGDVEQEDNEAEKVSSTAKFSIDGKEFTYENMKHEGGYKKKMDSYYDDDKDGQHSMMGPAYEGEWKGAESAFESYEGLMGAMKGSPEMASMIAMVAGIPGAENIHSQSALNDFADELRNKDPEGFDKFMTAASDHINNFVNDGQMVVNVINAGDHYQSTFSYGFNGNLEIGVDKDVHHDSYDVQFVDFLDADGNSMFNSDEAKARIREMFGLPSKADFKAGWSARCGQIVIQMIQVKIVTPEPDETPRPSSTPKPTPSSTPTPTPSSTPTPTPETSETPTPTPETSETPTPETPTPETPTPETSETPTPETPTPETPTPETPTPAPTVTPPVETLTPKGPDTHAGPNQQPMGPTEINNNDTKVTAEERGNVNPEVNPGAAVPGEENPDVNTETVNPGGLNQTEVTPAPDLSNPNSRTENVEHGGNANDLAERMRQAEQAEQAQRQAGAGQNAGQAGGNQ